jgi:predicted phage terminase large subunit-like protein
MNQQIDEQEFMQWLQSINPQEVDLQLARMDFIHYIHHIAPWFTLEEVHFLIADVLNRVIKGETNRVLINMPPRAGKSQTVSKFFPSWYMGHFPNEQVLQACYNVDLADEMGAAVREHVRDEDYNALFPNVELSKDTASKSKWALTSGGIYRTIGITSGAAGKGFNLGIIDDPLSENDAYSDAKRAAVRNWYGSGFYSRRQPEKNVIILMTTRWAIDDLQGHIENLQEEAEKKGQHTDKWEKLLIPGILDDESAEKLNSVAKRRQEVCQMFEIEAAQKAEREAKEIPLAHFKAGDSFAPRRWPMQEIELARPTMSKAHWEALIQQKPVQDSGAILKYDWWKLWQHKDPPSIEMVVQSYDTAFMAKEEADYSARTTWGVFYYASEDGIYRQGVVLLEAFQDRLEYPELREEIKRSAKEYKPDVILIEEKGSGISIGQELRRTTNLPIRMQQVKGDKITRAHLASSFLEGGAVWYMQREWAKEVIKQCADFPKGSHDDIVDTCTMCWNFLRKRYKLEMEIDTEEKTWGGKDPNKTKSFYG